MSLEEAIIEMDTLNRSYWLEKQAEDLLPCPFCGSKVEVWSDKYNSLDNYKDDIIYIKCVNCGVEVRGYDVLEAWNKRHKKVRY